MKNIVDLPDARKIQRVPVPLLGGVAVFFGMVVAFAVAGLLFDMSNMFAMKNIASGLIVVFFTMIVILI